MKPPPPPCFQRNKNPLSGAEQWAPNPWRLIRIPPPWINFSTSSWRKYRRARFIFLTNFYFEFSIFLSKSGTELIQKNSNLFFLSSFFSLIHPLFLFSFSFLFELNSADQDLCTRPMATDNMEVSRISRILQKSKFWKRLRD